jgi:hypothetical protein
MDPGRVWPQHSSRPSASVRTSALGGGGAGLAGDEPLATRATRGRAAHPHLGGIEQTALPGGA